MDNSPSIENSLPCFQSLSHDDLEILREKKRQLTYYPGETIFKQGAFASSIIFLFDGLAKVFLQTGPDKQINLHLATGGDFLAYSTLFGQAVYNYSAMAIKECTVCMLDKGALTDVLLRNPLFAMQITTRNTSNEYQLLEIIKNISYKQMRGKLASALIYLSQPAFKVEDVFSLLTRQDLADFASIANESTIKFLKEFEKEGIVKLNGKDIVIIDMEKLDNIAKKG